MDMDPKDLSEPTSLPQEEDAQQRPDPELMIPDRRPMLKWLIFGTLGLAAVLALIVTLVLPLLMEEPEPTPPPVVKITPTPTGSLAYEEPLSIDLQEQAIRADALITRTLIELGADPASIEAYAFPARGSEDFRARSLGFKVHAEPVTFQAHLAQLLKAELSKALLTPSGPRQFSIVMDGVRTHELFLEHSEIATPYTPTKPILPVEIKGLLAIVIDDMGEDTRLARGLAETGMDITFAVWPFSSHRDAVMAMAKEHSLDLLVHLPMEPKGYPEHDPGPNALFVNMSAEQIAEAVRTNLDMVPDAIGVNNHMGSKFTGNQFAMTAALRAINQRGLFFLDSRTTGKSKAPAASKATNTPFYGRDVFIDNEMNVPYIIGQLKKAETLARRRGSAIAIGHPHAETLQAIKTWAAGAGKDIAVVRLSALKTAIN